jgi:two-component system, cell cycle response regulator DivK
MSARIDASVSVAAAPRILIVEDDRNTRQFYSEALAAAGFRIEQAHNGFQALEKVIEFRPDLILTDIAVPGLDGIELCRRIRADARTCAIPLLAITGHGDRRYPDRARLAGADGVLSKPCAPELLVEAARGLLVPRLV